MTVLILHNPRSGKGRAAPLVEALSRALRARGLEPRAVEAGSPEFPAALRGARAAAVIGGDGTVHYALPNLAAARTPIWIIPTGTENLLARELRMTPSADAAAAAIERAVPRAMDLGVAHIGDTRHPFAVMLSVGPDASVIHRLAQRRTGAISHASYIRPILAELLRPALPALRVEADGAALVANRRGLLIVANCRQYALRVDPAPDADPADGLLDVVFLPCSTAIGAALWLLRARLRRATRHPRAVRARAANVRIALGPTAPASPLPLQMDGEAVGAGSGPLQVSVAPGALAVLTPAGPS